MYKLIAETAFSHEGDFRYLLSQIEEAAKAKVDYVKFQFAIPDLVATNYVKSAKYQKKNIK